MPQKKFIIHRILEFSLYGCFIHWQPEFWGQKTKKNVEPGTRVIQSLNSFLHFLPTTATEDSVAFARNPTLSFVHTNAVLWLLCFLAGAFIFPVLCRFYAQCFVLFSQFWVHRWQRFSAICWSGIYTSAFSLLRCGQKQFYIWCLVCGFWNKSLGDFFSSPCGHGLSRLKKWTSEPNSRSFELKHYVTGVTFYF